MRWVCAGIACQPTPPCRSCRGPALEQPGPGHDSNGAGLGCWCWSEAPLGRNNSSGDAPRQEAGGGAASGQVSSEHPHLGLGTKHSLLIGGQDQGLFAGHVVRLGADVALAIEEQHSQQLAGIEEMHRDDADRAGAAEGSAGHGWAGERHHRHALATPAPRKGRAAQRSDSRQPLRGAQAGAGRMA
jgi:hypothetical protein